MLSTSVTQIVSWALPPIFGAAIGYMTNAIAVKMLFRPHYPLRIGPFTFQGMIPRRKEEVARAVASLISSKLLREERLKSRLVDERFRQELKGLIAEQLKAKFDGELGPLEDLLGSERAEVTRKIFSNLLIGISARIEEWSLTREGQEALAGWSAKLASVTPAGILGGEVERFAEALGEVAAQYVQSPAAREKMEKFLARSAVKLASNETPLIDILPEPVVALIEEGVGKSAPYLIQRVEEEMLTGSGAERIKAAAREAVDKYLISTDGGPIKNIARRVAMMGRERILEEVDRLVEGNIPTLRKRLLGDENRERLKDALAGGVRDFLKKSPSELFSEFPSRRLDEGYGILANYILDELSNPQAALKIREAARKTVMSLSERPLGEWLESPEASGDKALAGLFTGFASSGGIRRVVESEAEAVTGQLMKVPLGDVATFLSGELGGEIVDAALDRLLPHLSERIPELLNIIGVEDIIEREVASFSSERLEELVLSVASRELGAITRWGGYLGGIIGIGQAALSHFLR